MQYSASVLLQVKNMGEGNASINEIIEEVSPENEVQFRLDISNIDTELGRTYHEAIYSVSFRKDIAETKQLEALASIEEINLIREKRVSEMITDYLGDNIELQIQQ